MNYLREWWKRAAGLFHKERRDAELEEELASHLEMMVEQNIERGMTAEEARRTARIALGGGEQIKEAVREQRGLPFLESLIADVRFGLRMLRKNPSFTTIAVLTLGLGVGVNASMFSIFDAFLFQRLPVSEPSQLAYVVSQNKRGGEGDGFSYADFQYIQNETTQVFSDVSAVSTNPLQGDGVSINGRNVLINTSYVSGNFFSMLGIKPALGRFILPSEGKTSGADPVLVISYSFWKTNFNADSRVVGRDVAIDGRPVTIIGVAPEGFHGATLSLIDTQGYLPLSMGAVGSAEMPGGALIARLRSGVSLDQANGLLNVVGKQLARQNPDDETWKTLRARSLGPLGPITGPNPIPIVAALFLTLAAFVLLLACMNLANLLLARGTTRRRETAVRSALGATRKRLIGQSLTETIMLALLGGCFGMVLGICAIRAMASFPIGITGSSSPLFFDFRFDWRVFAYALATALVAGLIAGGVPAMRASGVNLNDFLHDGARSTSEKPLRSRNLLVIAQVAGSFMLLIVAGLFARSLTKVQHVDLGFNPADVLNLSMDPKQAGYNRAQGQELLSEVLTHVRSLPGVESASFASTVPLGGTNFGAPLRIEGYAEPPGTETGAGDNGWAGENMVTAEYFATMGIPIVSGRGILDSDDANSPRVAVINQAMAEQYWLGKNPIGKTFGDDDPGFPRLVTLQVVGVVKNSETRTLVTALPIQPYFYVPLKQDYRLPVTLQVRTSNPLATAHEVQDAIRTLAPLLPIFDVQTMTQALDSVNGLILFKIAAGLAASLGALGLLLAVVGVYGVVSYAASQRTHEIGIRVALGAQRKQILAMILGQGCVVVGVGLSAGVLASLALSILVRKFLLGVSALDPITYLGVSAFLALIAMAACYVPARRAMRVDPMVALRHE
jgi:predicted permease